MIIKILIKNKKMEENTNNITPYPKTTRKRKQTSTVNNSIYNEILFYGITEEIAKRANHIYLSMNKKIFRKINKIYLYYYCTYFAYVELGMFIDAYKLADKFNINNDKYMSISKIFNKFKPIDTSYEPPIIHITPSNFLSSFIDELGMEPNILSSMEVILSRLELKKPNINKKYDSRILATGILKYFIFENNLDISDTKLKIVTSFSLQTINNVYNYILKIENKE